MSNPNCRPPICSFNCCNQDGLCPSSQNQCYHSNLKNPVWLYVIIGIVVIFIIVGAIIVLTIFKKRRLKRQQKQKQKQQLKETQMPESVQIEMKEKQSQPKILVNKKNIYVYERQVIDTATVKDTRSGSSSVSSKKSSRSHKTQNQQNPFEKKSRIRKRITEIPQTLLSPYHSIIQMQSKKVQIKDYISKNVNVFVQPLVYSIVKSRPANPVAFALNWLKEYAEKNKPHHDSDSQEEEEKKEDVVKLEALIQKKKAQGKSRSRMAISEEVFGSFNKKEAVELIEIPKDYETTLLIKSLIRNSILFQNIDSKDEEILIKAMAEKQYEVGEKVIQEGESGDELFIVESGEYDCSKVINGEQTYLKTYHQGEAFGQLALMYNAPRAASIVCKKPGKLYKLDRITFSQVVKLASFKKREMYKRVIDQIEVFNSINTVEKQQFLDILKEERYEEGQYVIKQGEQGNKFYIILEGQLVAEKTETAHELPRVVYKYKAGQYFGELALLHDVSRQASVKALTSVRVAYLDRESFKRIFGSMEDILKRNEEKYSLASQELICA